MKAYLRTMSCSGCGKAMEYSASNPPWVWHSVRCCWRPCANFNIPYLPPTVELEPAAPPEFVTKVKSIDGELWVRASDAADFRVRIVPPDERSES